MDPSDTPTELVDPLEQARDSIAREQSDEAYAILTTADRGQSLAPAGLEVLADAVCWAGHLEVSVETWERIHAILSEVRVGVRASGRKTQEAS